MRSGAIITKKWAYVVLVTETTRDNYKLAKPEIEILEADILIYLVWFSRYRYKLFNVSAIALSDSTFRIIVTPLQ